MAAAAAVFLAAVGFFVFYLFGGPRLVPRALLFGSPQKAAPQISPDGSEIAYLAPYQGVMNIWIHDRKTKAERVLTQDKGRGITNCGWSPDGKSVLFLQDRNGDENWHLYQIPREGGAVEDLTPFEGVQASILAGDKHFSEQILILLNREDRSRHDVYRLHFQTRRLELVAENSGRISGWLVDSELKVRGVVETKPEGGYDVSVRDDEKGPWKKIFSWDFEDGMNSSVVGFSKNGAELFLIDSRGADKARLIRWDISAGTGREVAADPEYDISGVSVNPDDHELEMVQVYRERSEWIALRESVRDDLSFLKNFKKSDFSIVSRDVNDRHWIIRFESDLTPVEYYVYDRSDKKMSFLFSNQPELSQYQFSPITPFKIHSRDGLTIRGYRTFPRFKKGPFPTVVLVHGGPWARDSWGYKPVVQWLANRGYACLQVNFRGSVGFGKAFVNAGNKEWGRKMQDDITDSVQWAIREGIADPGRVGIMGGSYGGYAALAAAAFSPDVFRCAIDLFGPSNLISLIHSMPPYWSVEKSNILRSIGDPDKEPELLRERSPLFHADRIRIPFLIAQGANDPRTPKSESDQVVEALRKRGVPCEYIVFEDEGHGFVKPENRLKFYQAAEAFLAKHLGGRYEP